MDSTQFWSQHGFSHIISPSTKSPEGDTVFEKLKNLIQTIDYETVVDFGCGCGRLCTLFPKEKYLGIDVNTEALDVAQKTYRDYSFSLLTPKPLYADVYLAHNVFLHLTDKTIDTLLKNVRCKYFILSEILGKEWHRSGIPPIYGRNLEDYLYLMRAHDFILTHKDKESYAQYAKTTFYQNKNTDLSFLVFKKLRANSTMS